jgi:hypothetical protein
MPRSRTKHTPLKDGEGERRDDLTFNAVSVEQSRKVGEDVDKMLAG